jgi:hypothetical protein
MTDDTNEYRVGQTLANEDDLLALPVGSTIQYKDPYGYDDDPEPYVYVRTVNGYIIIKGPSWDLGEFIPNDDVPTYFNPIHNFITHLPDLTRTEDDCSCGGLCGPEEAKADAAEPIKPKEFVALFPNDPDDPRKETPRGDVLREAEHLITGDRNKTYGPPTQNFRNIADLMNIRFAHLLGPSKRFTGSDVADLMILVKVARNAADKKRDTYTDIAGYAACECYLDED